VGDRKVESLARAAGWQLLATRLLALCAPAGQADCQSAAGYQPATSLPHKIIAGREETKM
jgi:hypothetical protein